MGVIRDRFEMPADDHAFMRRMLKTILMLTGVCVVIILLWWARTAIALIYVSALIAMGFSPLVRWVQRSRLTPKRVHRWVAILIVYFTIIGLLTLIGMMVVPPIMVQATALWEQLPVTFAKLQNELFQHGLISKRVTLQDAVQSGSVGTGPAAPLNMMLVAGSTMFEAGFAVIFVLILSFYLLIEAQSIFEYLVRFVPEHKRSAVTTVASEGVVRISAWMRANLVLGLIMGSLCAVVLWLLGVPYYYVVAFIAAIGEMVPIVGPLVAGVVAVGIAVTKSGTLAIAVAAFFIVLHEIEANILVPKIMERGVGISAVATICALLIGIELGGIVGALLSIPTTALLAVIIEQTKAARTATPVRPTLVQSEP